MVLAGNQIAVGIIGIGCSSVHCDVGRITGTVVETQPVVGRHGGISMGIDQFLEIMRIGGRDTACRGTGIPEYDCLLGGLIPDEVRQTGVRIGNGQEVNSVTQSIRLHSDRHRFIVARESKRYGILMTIFDRLKKVSHSDFSSRSVPHIGKRFYCLAVICQGTLSCPDRQQQLKTVFILIVCFAVSDAVESMFRSVRVRPNIVVRGRAVRFIELLFDDRFRDIQFESIRHIRRAERVLGIRIGPGFPCHGGMIRDRRGIRKQIVRRGKKRFDNGQGSGREVDVTGSGKAQVLLRIRPIGFQALHIFINDDEPGTKFSIIIV